ncbi:MAG: biotin--[Paludibacteraceae bacterium]|nr:biotin--[acetyl-CoA-carboxylase] ligase [Paludibacteraceae bacterium]
MYVAQTHSTNSLIQEQYLDQPDLFTVRTDYQTAGRGQKGNRWEAQRGQNLLFSTLIKQPAIPVDEQFLLSMAVSLAVRDMVKEELDKQHIPSDPLTVKWPNDIYWGDKKLCGMLLEASLQGSSIAYVIAGVGLNVNQTQWDGVAPNPISMKEITGTNYDLNRLMDSILECLKRRLQQLFSACRIGDIEPFRQEYSGCLYRREGWHLFAHREVDLTPTMPLPMAEAQEKDVFEAKIVEVDKQGQLVLLQRDGKCHTYHFKQIRYVI